MQALYTRQGKRDKLLIEKRKKICINSLRRKGYIHFIALGSAEFKLLKNFFWFNM